MFIPVLISGEMRAGLEIPILSEQEKYIRQNHNTLQEILYQNWVSSASLLSFVIEHKIKWKSEMNNKALFKLDFFMDKKRLTMALF